VRRLVPLPLRRVLGVRHVGADQVRARDRDVQVLRVRSRPWRRPGARRRPRGRTRGRPPSSRCRPPRGRSPRRAACAPPARGEQRRVWRCGRSRGCPAAARPTQSPSMPWPRTAARPPARVVAEQPSGVSPASVASACSSDGSSVSSRPTPAQVVLGVELEASRTARSRWIASDGRRRRPTGQPHEVQLDGAVGGRVRPGRDRQLAVEPGVREQPPYGSTPTRRYRPRGQS
jgi:hypothetical protein